MHQVCRCGCVVLAHEAGAVDFDRAVADLQGLADFLGGQAFEQAGGHLTFAPGEFDVIIISEMLEHVDDPRAVLQQVHAICTPATRLVITVPNERPKLVIKDVLRALRLFDLLFPGIEEGQSEWHLQQFSKPLIRETVKGLFTVQSISSVWGAHYAAKLTALA